jgi:8-oxo-dGTP pyrophosphatase MutT (NUDIX family)
LLIVKEDWVMVEKKRQALHHILEEYQPWNAHEKRCLEKMQMVLSSPDVLSDRFFSPGHFTASAMLLSPDEASVLLIFHPAFQLWIQPGGHLDEGDNACRDCAIRELYEEASVRIVQSINWLPELLDIDVHQVPENPRKQQPPHEHYDLRYVFRAGDRVVKASNEIKEVKWVPLDQFEEINTDDSVRRSVKKILWYRQQRQMG